MGVLTLLLALVSPLDTLGDTYLFSAHMAQHLLLVLVVPPLLLLGIPPLLWDRLFANRLVTRVERMVGQPPLSWVVGVATVWLWHAPALYNATLRSEGIHVVEHVSFLVSATIFWWPVVAPTRHALAPWRAVAYLALGAFANTILAIVLTFAPVGIYPAYLEPVDRLGILPLLRQGWRLSPQADQQLGGVLMWIPGGWVYLLAIVGSVARWYSEPDDDALETDQPLTGFEGGAPALGEHPGR